MTWRDARTAALVVAAPLVAGLAAGAIFELTRTVREPYAFADAPPVVARRSGAPGATSVDELWERMVREASARLPDDARTALQAERW